MPQGTSQNSRGRPSKKVPLSKRSLKLFVYFVSVLESFVALLTAKFIWDKFEELLVAWPFELTFCLATLAAILICKVCQIILTFVNSSKKGQDEWLHLLICIPCLVLLCGAAFSCREAKMRMDYRHGVRETYTMNGSPFEIPNNFKDAQNLPGKFIDINQMISIASYDHKYYIRDAWDHVQTKFQCCGSESANNWLLFRKRLPVSCCPAEGMFSRHVLECTPIDAYPKGCSATLTEVILNRLEYVEVAVHTTFAFEFILAVVIVLHILHYLLTKRTVPECNYCTALENRNANEAIALMS